MVAFEEEYNVNEMNILGGHLKQNARGVKKIMTVSLSHSRTLAAPPSTTHPLFLNHHYSAGMSTTTTTTTSNPTDLDPIFKLKRILRSKVRKSLMEMDPSQRSLEDDAIQSMVLDAPWFKSSRRLCAYISCYALREVDTSKVLVDILQTSDKGRQKLSGKTLYVPRVEDKNSHMRMLNISGLEDLIANSMDILEPAPVDNKGNQREDGNHI